MRVTAQAGTRGNRGIESAPTVSTKCDVQKYLQANWFKSYFLFFSKRFAAADVASSLLRRGGKRDVVRYDAAKDSYVCRERVIR